MKRRLTRIGTLFALSLTVAVLLVIKTGCSTGGRVDDLGARRLGSNTLAWRTESEQGNYGFFIERSDSPEGPFTRVNDLMIAGHGDTNVPHAYEFEDKNLEVGRTYYYRLWSITYQGQQELIGESYKTVASDDGEPG